MGQKTEGIIARLNKGFGFIEIPNHEDVFFFHAQDLQNNQAFDELRPKMVVEFVPIDDTRKPGKIRGSEVTVLHDKGPRFGFIKSLNNGFGFLSVQGEDIDYFFHRRDILTRIPFDELFVGMEMSFVPISGKEGKPAASKVEVSMPGPSRGGNRGGGPVGRGVYHGKVQGFSYGNIGQSMRPPYGGPGPYGRAPPPSYGHAQRYSPYGAAPPAHAPPPRSYGAPPSGRTYGHAAPQAPAPGGYGAPSQAYGAPSSGYGAPQPHAPPSQGYGAAPAAQPYAPPASQAYAPAQAGYGKQY